jgi:hypothetical protein
LRRLDGLLEPLQVERDSEVSSVAAGP